MACLLPARPQYLRQLAPLEGLLQEAHAAAEAALLHDRVLGIARHVDRLERRAAPTGFLGELASSHAARHHDVGEEDRDPLRLVDQAKRGLAIRGNQRFVAEGAEHLRDEHAHVLVVLHDEHGLGQGPAQGVLLGAEIIETGNHAHRHGPPPDRRALDRAHAKNAIPSWPTAPALRCRKERAARAGDPGPANVRLSSRARGDRASASRASTPP
jgi:hypothetical protein